MQDSKSLKRQIQDLGSQGLRVIADSSLSTQQKNRRCEELQTQITDLTTELTQAQFVEAKRNAFTQDGLIDLGADTSNQPYHGVAKGFGRIAPIGFAEKDLAGLYDASTKNLPFAAESLGTKATDSTAVVMDANPNIDTNVRPFLREPTRIASLIPSQAVDAPTSWYFRQSTASSAAAATAEGATKPLSAPAWSKFIATAQKISHRVQVTTEAANDFPAFMSLVESDMIGGLVLAENDQLLNGNGTPPNQTGLLNASGILTRARTTEPSVETLYNATLDLRVGTSYIKPDVMVLNPTTYANVRLLKDANSQYYGGGPFTGAYGGNNSGNLFEESLWGIPVIVTTQIATGTALVANLGEGARIYSRETARLMTDPYSQSSSNVIQIIAEERLALAVVRPTCIVKVTSLP